MHIEWRTVLRARRPSIESNENGTCVEMSQRRQGSKNRQGVTDLAAFVAVLAMGTALVLLGHVPTGGLSTACLALGGLFSVWQHFHKRPHR